MVRRWSREPLVHFLALGLGLFVIYGWLNSDAARSSTGDRIDVSEPEIAYLSQTWSRQWGRPPTSKELDGLVNEYIREEVLYREALAMGLDGDDTIIRRRLVQKLEFLAEDLAMSIGASDDQLDDFFEEGRETYRVPARVSFTHIYFSPDQRGDAAEPDARRELAALGSNAPARAPDRGDRFMLQYDYASQSPQQVARLFGDDFAGDLFELDSGAWQGPIVSGYGVHLVRIADRVEGRMPDLDEVRERVQVDFEAERRRQARELFYSEALKNYDVQVDPDALAAGAIGAAGSQEVGR